MVNLIIADDEIAIRQGLEKLVTGFDLGVNCVGTAADGEQALGLVEQLRPQLLLVDINMPKLNGLDMIAQAKRLIPNGKIIVIWGYDNFDFVRQALRLGVFDYLLKPINHGALYVTLSDAIEAIENNVLT